MPDTSRSTIKPIHKAIQGYYSALQSFSNLNVSLETVKIVAELPEHYTDQ